MVPSRSLGHALAPVFGLPAGIVDAKRLIIQLSESEFLGPLLFMIFWHRARIALSLVYQVGSSMRKFEISHRCFMTTPDFCPLRILIVPHSLSMDEDKQREIASKGGKASHEQGSAHEFDSDEARAAGSKGGQSHGGGSSGQGSHNSEGSSSSTRGGTSEQHAKAGSQSHKNEGGQSGSGSGSHSSRGGTPNSMPKRVAKVTKINNIFV